jgi:hypothetical protein
MGDRDAPPSLLSIHARLHGVDGCCFTGVCACVCLGGVRAWVRACLAPSECLQHCDCRSIPLWGSTASVAADTCSPVVCGASLSTALLVLATAYPIGFPLLTWLLKLAVQLFSVSACQQHCVSLRSSL